MEKRCVESLDFGIACGWSKHIMLIRKCAQEAFGQQVKYSSKPNQDHDVDKMIALFFEATIFVNNNVHEMTQNFSRIV